jgi:hypothetical protein
VGLPSSRYLTGLSTYAAPQERTDPKNSIMRWSQLEVTVDRQAALPLQFHVPGLEMGMRGEYMGSKIGLTPARHGLSTWTEAKKAKLGSVK